MTFKEFLIEGYQSSAERLARKDNRGDKLALSRITEIKKKRDAGLISDGEAERMFNNMTKDSKERSRRLKQAKESERRKNNKS